MATFTINIIGKSMGNVQMTSTLTRNNCPINTIAGSATYTVAAGVYESTDGQDVANALAQDDIDANAQNYVNENAACVPIPNVKPVTISVTYAVSECCN